MKRVILLIVDGWGVGAQEDAEEYGDQLAHTMGHVSETTMLKLPNFQKMGLGNIIKLASIPPATGQLLVTNFASYHVKTQQLGTGNLQNNLEKAFPLPKCSQKLIHSFCQ